MPRLWDLTIDTHRDAVRGAILDAGFALAAERGLTAVTMAGVARTAGIGRATLYRYFADPEAILHAWHERQVAQHLARLAALAEGAGAPLDRLATVLGAWGGIVRRSDRHGAELGQFLHGASTDHAHQALAALVAGLLREAGVDGAARADAPPEELAAFCLHAMGAAGALPTEAAVERLVEMTLDGVRRS